MTVANIIKKIANRVIKSKRKKLFKLEVKEGPGANKNRKHFEKIDKKSPYYNVDELGARPLHRGTGTSGGEKQKLKKIGKNLSDEFKKKDKAADIREKRRGGTKMGYAGGGIAQRGLGRAFRRGEKV